MKDEALKQKLGMEQRNRGSVGFQEALAQPEPYDQTALELCNVCGWKTLIPDDACLNCERAQPKQEPVAWYVDFGNEDEPNYASIGEKPIEKMAIIRPLAFSDTTPPHRTWVGLTDEDIDQGLLRSNHALQTAGAWRDGVEWATKQLKEKNT